MTSKIQWTGDTWNPIVGCRRVSPGCENCYAEKQVHRGMAPQHKGLTVLGKNGVRWNGAYNVAEHRMNEPLRKTKPRTWFVNSLSDLFFEPLPFELIAAIFGVMAACPQHTFQVLTKRPARAVEFFAWLEAVIGMARPWAVCAGYARKVGVERSLGTACMRDWGPLANVHLGVSVEDQATADHRIPLLLELPAAVRWVSYEPALGPVDFTATPPPPGWTPVNGATLDDLRGCLSRYQADGYQLFHGIDWIVVGGESGPGARPFDLAWARSTIAQCRAAGVPVFVKQLGARPYPSPNRVGDERLINPVRDRLRLVDRKGGDMSEWPKDLRVREVPDV
jgi:protein gp37